MNTRFTLPFFLTLVVGLTSVYASKDSDDKMKMGLVNEAASFIAVSVSTMPSFTPSVTPFSSPSAVPSDLPSSVPSTLPTVAPSTMPSARPSVVPSAMPSTMPSLTPSDYPSNVPSSPPSLPGKMMMEPIPPKDSRIRRQRRSAMEFNKVRGASQLPGQ
ncbi:hypothetical protein ACA910_000128 [Epithemia clementina (nom. ined.)]